ncbi:UDP-N-acetylglucosamine 1-carboxyvinyltransferase [candidate division WOR-3 bacterium]|jgi:UDP-N-acetylglucosamine 1-carboxyvinyltransferase|nr:UDP-N-acetylglucosamine 1-carboxyvinyltransferase [candidate division WOR-3 bacterium]
MQQFVIEGGKKLSGEVKIAGAKNSALPIIAASLLTDKKVVLENIPDLIDVRTMIELIQHLGADVIFNRHVLKIHTAKIKKIDAPYDIVRKMRASYYVLGALLARVKKAKVSLPGGCAIGPRPIDLHIKGLRTLGASIEIKDGFINAHTRKLLGHEVNIEGPKGTSVGATINVMIAAAQAKGETIISPAACEPEVIDVANFLNATGFDITGQGTHRITIKGKSSATDVKYSVIPDRIEAGTFAAAAAITCSSITIQDCCPDHLTSILDKLEEIGVMVERGEDNIVVHGTRRLHATNIFVTTYPGFPTDMQAQFMALLSIVPGTSTVKETIFENRFMQALELMRMGADITIEGDTAVINGVNKLSGAYLMASDLRASAALVLAGLVAKGKTVVRRIYHLDRGYEKFETKLRRLGAKIKRQSE